MTLRLECTKRNYELEELKHKVKSHRIALRDHPLIGEEKDFNEADSDNDGRKEDNEDSAATTITHKLGQADPMADFHKLEF